MDLYSIAGGWLGAYYFDDGDEPCRFEATFDATDSRGRFLGRILDDGYLGEANAEGTQTALTVSFVKVYIRPPDSRAVAPVDYRGEMSEDGMRLTGVWRISRRTGTWDARRLWFESTAEEVRSESEGVLVGAR